MSENVQTMHRITEKTSSHPTEQQRSCGNSQLYVLHPNAIVIEVAAPPQKEFQASSFYLRCSIQHSKIEKNAPKTAKDLAIPLIFIQSFLSSYLVEVLNSLDVASLNSIAFINKAIKNPIPQPPIVTITAFAKQFLSNIDDLSNKHKYLKDFNKLAKFIWNKKLFDPLRNMISIQIQKLSKDLIKYLQTLSQVKVNGQNNYQGKQPATGTKKSKDQIAKAASTGAKAGKKKWTKGRVKEKKDNAVFFDKASFKKFTDEIPKMKLITVSTVMDKMRLNGSLVRRGLKHLQEKGLITEVTHSCNNQYIYTSAIKKAAEKKE